MCNVLLRGGDELTNCTCTYNVVTPLSSSSSSSPCYTVGHSSRFYLLLPFLPTKRRAHTTILLLFPLYLLFLYDALNRHLWSSGVIDFRDTTCCAPRKLVAKNHFIFYVLPLSSRVNPYGSGNGGGVDHAYFTQTI